MKQKVIKWGGMVMLVVLITSLLAVFAGGGLVAAAGANPVRGSFPYTVYPGQTFQVTVTFTAPADNFNAIGLDDVAPTGWTVSVNKTWCSPDADVDYTPNPNEAAYIWFGPYDSGTGFTAVYNVTVPCDATPGDYDFNGTLEYYVNTTNYKEDIGGDYQVYVARDGWSANSGGVLKTSFTTSDTVYATGKGFPPSQYIDIYVVNATDWAQVVVSASAQAGGCGSLPVTEVWADPLTPGTWDLWFDVNQNGDYDEGDVYCEFTVTSGPAPSPVGGTAYPVNKALIIALLSALGAAVAAGIVILERRRRKAQS
jgi:hypothetical protein